MFDQATFDSAGRRAAVPWTMSISVALQATVITTAILVPLLRIEPLPKVHLVEPKLAPPHMMTIAVPQALRDVFRNTMPKIPSPFQPKVFVEPTQRPQQLRGSIIDPDFNGLVNLDTGIPPLDLSTMPTLNPTSIAVAPPKSEPATVKTQPSPVVDKTYRVGGDVKSPSLKSAPPPAYPPLAKATRTQGTVRLNGIISRDGTVRSLELISGHPLLVQAALNAVRAWLYEPARLNGQPVDVILVIDVNFKLTQ
jgi:periplasmic protein TonB